jgi:hypothetical protein
MEIFHKTVKKTNQLNNRDVKFELYIRQFPNVELDLVYVWNMLFFEAYDMGCEYFMHITDDVDFMKSTNITVGWQDQFISLLRNNSNFGLIGSTKEVNTMPFVHKTHLEMMNGWFYSRITHNVMCDTALWTLYKAIGLLVGPENLGHWLNLSDEKNTRRYHGCEIDHYYEIFGVLAPPQYPDLNYAVLNQFASSQFNVTFSYTPAPTAKPTVAEYFSYACRLAKAFNPSVVCDDKTVN